MKRASAVLLVCSLAAASLGATTFTVTNTNDSGAGSLRQALLDADANGGPDTVAFAIPGGDPGCSVAGVCTIALASPLAQVNGPVVIDGYTQPGSSANTDPVADDAVLLVVLSGSALSNGNGLQIAGGATTVRGLVINGFTGSGITIVGTDGDVVEGNFLGTDASGTTAVPNGAGGGHGVDILAGNGHTVGGLAPAARNVISGNVYTGIRISVLDDITIVGNLIGTQRDGASPLGNGANGVGFEFGGSTGTGDMVGGRAAGAGNVIAYNGADGVFLQPNMKSIPIVGNSMFANVRVGIDLSCCSPLPNDAGDADDGANHLQNFPIIQSVIHGASTTEAIGKLDSTPSTTFDLDFYADSACTNRPREFVQGRTYLGTAQATTNGSGRATFDAILSVATEAGARISATATDPAGNTSELSQRIVFQMQGAVSGIPAGGTGIIVSGTDFADGSTMTVGGVSTPVAFVNDRTLNSTSPPLPPGTVNDVVVTTPDGTTGTLAKAWVSEFLDVPGSQQFYNFVTTLVSNGITVGVGGGNYGVDQPTLRQQMAVFILKAKHGLCYTPPPCTGVFTDVPCPSGFAPWIEAMAAEGITGGCGTGIFCPTNPVRRDQMAVFLLKGEHGSSYLPPTCTGIFGDVTCPSTFANWIEQLATEQITGGCGAGIYCPASPNTRGQMAVFITKTFHLQ
jgi:hypothetical protein